MQELIEVVKIAGPTGATAVIFLIYLDRMDKRHSKIISNHMEHSTDSMNKFTEVLSQLSKSIDILGKTMKGKVIKKL